jgi:hypothetical protein
MMKTFLYSIAIPFQSSPTSTEPPDEATAAAVANAFLKSVGEAVSSDDREDDEQSISDDDQVWSQS